MLIKSLFPLLMLIIIIFISGCAQTGSIINTSSEKQANPTSQALPENTLLLEEMPNKTVVTEPEPETSADEMQEKEEETYPCEDLACPNSVTSCEDGFKARCNNTCEGGFCSVCIPDCSGHDTCAGITCEDSVETCLDGYEASCSNECLGGACEECVPDCTGHESAEEECKLSCGKCEYENIEDCSCDIIIPCDGNGICESGEYPESVDCPDCNDGNGCTEDLFDFTLRECYQEVIVPCCGNGECENTTDPHENHTNCPADCEAPNEQPQEPPEQDTDISITFIEPYQELVEISNLGSAHVNMTGWKLSDIANHAYQFPVFVLDASSSVFVHTEHGTDNSTDLFWNRGSPVWNNDGDNATLKNSLGEVESTYAY